MDCEPPEANGRVWNHFVFPFLNPGCYIQSVLNKSVDAIYDDAWFTVGDNGHCLGKMMPHKQHRVLQLAKHCCRPYLSPAPEAPTTSPSTEHDNKRQRLWLARQSLRLGSDRAQTGDKSSLFKCTAQPPPEFLKNSALAFPLRPPRPPLCIAELLCVFSILFSGCQ